MVFRGLIRMASLFVRITINLMIVGVVFSLGLLFIGAILLLIFNTVPLIFLLLFIPLWIIILIIERELIWTLVFLVKKAPYKKLSKTSGKHEKILKDYLSSNKKEQNNSYT